jgi:16S rRNA G966 N2-methylase RsmD
MPKINDLELGDGGWKNYPDILTSSLWQFDHADDDDGETRAYWGNFIPQVPRQLMLRYTKAGDTVLDPFAGSGTTAIEALKLGRHSISLDLYPEKIQDLAQRVAQVQVPSGRERCRAFGYVANALSMLEVGQSVGKALGSYGQQHVQLVILHPPYHNAVKFGEANEDLSNSVNPTHFATRFSVVLGNCLKWLEPGRHCAIVIGDVYLDGVFHSLTAECVLIASKHGLKMKAHIVKDLGEGKGKRGQRNLWRYRALAGGYYTFGFESILIFQKPEK